MNSLIIVGISLVLFFCGYKFFAKSLELLFGVNPKEATPAYSKFDSVDYIPAKNWVVLFGHHFSSVAGAGPIIGPVIAVALWGWFPALLWVIIGAIFIGGAHDFGSLIISVKEGGSSVADIAGAVISAKAKIILSLFVWLTLILVIAVFSYLCADTFVKEPKIVLPSLGLIPVAMITGHLLYFRRVNSALATIFGLVCLAALIFLGNNPSVNAGINIWLLVLFIYCYFASILPVNVLLQPRDYLSSFLLFFGVGAGLAGLLWTRPMLTVQPFLKSAGQSEFLWPMLFVTVACGAVSGFHSLIASGTTSKQLANQRHVKRISYGAMMLEAVVAVLAIIAAAILPTAKSLNPIAIFSQGYGIITNTVLLGAGSFIAITILNAFILTTLDTAVRIARYLTEELFGLKNRYLSTFAVVVPSAALTFSGKWNKIWPAFGASNQLVAALVLFVLACWLIAKNKPARIMLYPAFFMLATAVAALILQAVKYFNKDNALFITVAALLILSAFMMFEIVPVLLRGLSKKND